jgi:hypothetical protein
MTYGGIVHVASQRFRLITAATLSSAALLLGALAQAPIVEARAGADWITAEPGETLQCASARSALRKFMPKRGPKSVLKGLQADETRLCAMTTELVENWDGSVSEKTRMVDEPIKIPTIGARNNWRSSTTLAPSTGASHYASARVWIRLRRSTHR